MVPWWCLSGFHTERERDTVFAVSWSYLGGVLLVVSRQLVVSQWRFSVVMLTIMNADDDDDDDDDFEEEDDCADGDVMVMELVVLMMTMMLLLLMMMMVVMLMLMLTLMLTLMLMLMMMMLLLLVMTMTVQFCVEAGAGRMLTYVWNGTNALAISYFRASAQATALRTCPDAMQQPGLWGALEELMM